MRRINREIFANCGEIISPTVSLFDVSQSSGKDLINYEILENFSNN